MNGAVAVQDFSHAGDKPAGHSQAIQQGIQPVEGCALMGRDADQDRINLLHAGHFRQQRSRAQDRHAGQHTALLAGIIIKKSYDFDRRVATELSRNRGAYGSGSYKQKAPLFSLGWLSHPGLLSLIILTAQPSYAQRSEAREQELSDDYPERDRKRRNHG